MSFCQSHEFINIWNDFSWLCFFLWQSSSSTVHFWRWYENDEATYRTDISRSIGTTRLFRLATFERSSFIWRKVLVKIWKSKTLSKFSCGQHTVDNSLYNLTLRCPLIKLIRRIFQEYSVMCDLVSSIFCPAFRAGREKHQLCLLSRRWHPSIFLLLSQYYTPSKFNEKRRFECIEVIQNCYKTILRHIV